ncbi:MAG: hypothetical protein R3B13_31860 [Polyangiaceae bacterium]
MRAFASSTLGDLHISLWNGDATVNDVADLHQELDALAETAPRFSILLVVTATAPVAGHAARKRAAEMLARHAERVASVAIVLEGTGFWAASIRSVFTSIAFLLRPPFAWRVFSSAESASMWQLPHLEHRDRRAVADVLNALRAELNPLPRTRSSGSTA